MNTIKSVPSLPLSKMVCGLMLALGTQFATAEEAPSAEEMWRIIQEQQKTIESLKAKLDETEATVEDTKEQVAANTEAVEDVEDTASNSSLSWANNTSVGGYGELHYNNLDGKEDQVDFHRFVLFVDHEFNDRLRLFTELELEHSLSGDDKPGEVELEQAYIQYDLNSQHSLNAGLYLVPVGLLNETHEPNTFFGVERNNVEKNIIPTTWWEAGLGLTGEVAPGWRYDVMLSSGLETPTSGSKAYLIRSGRNKVAEAPGEDGAITGRIRYTGMPGLEVGLTAQYQADITQGAEDIDATLIETHLDYRSGGFGLRALYAGWWLDDGNALTGPAALGRDRQEGFYIEPSYRFNLASLGEAGVFARYQQWNNNAGGSADDNEQVDVGVNFWPHQNVVFKFDYQFQNEAAGDHDGFNLGVGYQF